MAEALWGVIILDGAHDEVSIEKQNLVRSIIDGSGHRQKSWHGLGVVNTLQIRCSSSRANGLTIDYWWLGVWLGSRLTLQHPAMAVNGIFSHGSWSREHLKLLYVWLKWAGNFVRTCRIVFCNNDTVTQKGNAHVTHVAQFCSATVNMQ